MKVLIAEDELHIREGLCEILEKEGYEVVAAEDGEQAWQQYQQVNPDFVCLDIMMPKMNGYDVCRQIRQQNVHIPIIFITAKTEEVDKVLGLELGADDYISKPFGVKEVVARVRAVTRRCLMVAKTQSTNFQMAEWNIQPEALKAVSAEKEIDLSLREIKILNLLYERRGEVISRDEMFDVCWGRSYMPNSRTLDQTISKLRKRIEKNPGQPEIIQTVHGAGYRY
jgi:DNA-binding response OmpR family regulator